MGCQATKVATVPNEEEVGPQPQPSRQRAKRKPQNLIQASKAGNLVRVQELLKSNMNHDDVNTRGMWQATPLINACQYGHEVLALTLLETFPHIQLHLMNERSVSALTYAALEGLTKVVLKLFELEPELLVKSQSQKTTEVLEMQDLDLDNRIVCTPGLVYNPRTDENVVLTPLTAAVMNGHVEIVKVLLHHRISFEGVLEIRYSDMFTGIFSQVYFLQNKYSSDIFTDIQKYSQIYSIRYSSDILIRKIF